MHRSSSGAPRCLTNASAGTRRPSLCLSFLLTGAAVASASDYDRDGSATPADCDDFDAAVLPGADDRRDLAFEDANCDGIDGELTKAIFVDGVNGADANSGMREAPKRSLASALPAARAAGKDVYLTAGAFSEPLALEPDMGIYGGYASGFATRARDRATIVSGGGTTAALADGDTGVELQLLTLAPLAGRTGDTSSYGLRAINGAKVLLEEVEARGSDGAAGAFGQQPAQPTITPARGGDGEPGACGTGLALGGAQAVPAAGTGGNGGTSVDQPGKNGSPATGPGAGSGGIGAPVGGSTAGSARGVLGADGTDGANAAFTLERARGLWLGGDGVPGGDGQSGGAGGGGGGGYGGGTGGIGVECPVTVGADVFTAQSGFGQTGGHGGAGGFGGDGGAGAGGPSAAVFRTGAASAYAVRDTSTSVAQPGEGGIAGLPCTGAAGGVAQALLESSSAGPIGQGDFDGDGVADQADGCTAVAVAGTGCRPRARLLDADRDGVPDRADRCPQVAVPAGASDRDGDGCHDKLSARLTFSHGRPGKRSTRLTRLVVRDISKGSTVRVTCKGRGCFKAVTKRNVSGTLNLKAQIRKPLRTGTRITVTVSRAGAVSAVRTLTIRKARKPLVRNSVLGPRP